MIEPRAYHVRPARPLSSGLLLLGCVALAGVIAIEFSEDIALAPDVTAAAPSLPEVAETVVEPFEPPPPDLFSVISERPLFVASRRPFVAPVEPEPEAGPTEAPLEPLAAELVGVMLTGGQRSVLIQREGSASAERIAVGQSVDGWRVEEVDQRHALLRRGAEKQVLELRRD